jgi:uncharacterized protein YndB with AHSA1/START domain
MPIAETRRIVDAYHRAWTTKRFDRALALLAPSLQVEVPINDYATREAFAEALVRFGREVVSVDVLSELAGHDEAMILYDMEVTGLGTMRIVEHFTIDDGKIVRLRQIHDTAPWRVGDVDRAVGGTGEPDGFAASAGDGYEAEFVVHAPCRQVFDAVTSLEGLVGWWASSATGCGLPGSRFTLEFAGLDETITWRVDTVIAPTSLVWTCLSHTGLPDWNGTTISFELSEPESAVTVVTFRHTGLVPALDCYEQCRAGWEHFLPSLTAYSERGRGTPFAGLDERA